MSAKLHTKSYEVGKLKVGDKIEFVKVYAVVSKVLSSEKEGPTFDDDVLLVELVGDCGPFKGKKTRIAASAKAKVTVVLRTPFLLKLKRIWDYLVTPRKP